jgi:NAD-dependent SIR2 family protein deacetylase
MPKWICMACTHEFWGWALYHRYRSGEKLLCPDCEGDLVLKSDKKATDIITRLLNGSTGAKAV